MKDGRLREGGTLLAGHAAEYPELAADFPNRAVAAVERECQRLMGEKLWRDADASARQLTEDAQLISLLNAEQLKKLRQLCRDVRVAEDRDLYEQLRRLKDMQRAQRYLDAAPVQTMQREARQYRDYLL